jgi:hypothetical protein
MNDFVGNMSVKVFGFNIPNTYGFHFRPKETVGLYSSRMLVTYLALIKLKFFVQSWPDHIHHRMQHMKILTTVGGYGKSPVPYLNWCSWRSSKSHPQYIMVQYYCRRKPNYYSYRMATLFFIGLQISRPCIEKKICRLSLLMCFFFQSDHILESISIYFPSKTPKNIKCVRIKSGWCAG